MFNFDRGVYKKVVDLHMRGCQVKDIARMVNVAENDVTTYLRYYDFERQNG